jgi:hypothetical protein
VGSQEVLGPTVFLPIATFRVLPRSASEPFAGTLPDKTARQPAVRFHGRSYSIKPRTARRESFSFPESWWATRANPYRKDPT